ncbi:hypothetical protein ACFQV2_26930 [Actinokineospora soli]|uniref:Uncharacterized protein n=1 Tax=Actinokineospora soli TaxID=1048753 RepID=A0ABW2TSU5_9PSEU
MRRFFRFLFRLVGAAIAVSLDLERPQQPETKPRAARRIRMDARRD